MKNKLLKAYIFIYFSLLRPWSKAISISAWNKYFEHPMYEFRVQYIGEKLAKEMFFNDSNYMYHKYRQEVFKDKKLLLKIIFCPFAIKPNNYLTKYKEITANDLWG